MPSPSRSEGEGDGDDPGTTADSRTDASTTDPSTTDPPRIDPALSAHAVASLGEIDPGGSRQRGRRSAVALTDEAVVVGTADGDLRAFERDDDAGRGESDALRHPAEDDTAGEFAPERWRLSGDEPVVALTPFDDGVLVGTRGEHGFVRLVDADGDERWRLSTADDVGPPAKETRFWYPFVAAIETHGDRGYAAARRYERRETEGDATARRFESVVYAIDPDGTVAWRYAAAASPIAVAADGDRVAVAYNRCPEPDAHDDGLVALDPETGEVRLRWDPRRAPDAGGERGDPDAARPVGDVALTPGGYAVASHADYRGYLLDRDGTVRASVDLGTPVDRARDGGDADADAPTDRVYAYPNHVHAGPAGVAFVVGNTFPEEGRETAARHPAEHTAVGVDLAGTERWRADVGGFAHHVAGTDDALAVPAAQHFRDRDPSVHGVRLFDLGTGAVSAADTDGVATAVALTDEAVAAVEEPVAYHDGDGDERGAYQVHRWRR
ncbi:PQQ-binding-like beta-propeller repeat protein [Halorubrum salinum]|uniref:PQQ-binding-like beta-propeller repeat protein n=1 Tax=Halorubrum salinum TaxID=767517 RepID=UPI0021118347|nr:PQQ-binding-like beta-propeller repeat protein [Halorubrum salinum]